MSMVYPHIELAAYCDLGLQHGFWLWFSSLCLGVVAAAVVVSIVCPLHTLHLVASSGRCMGFDCGSPSFSAGSLFMFKGCCKGFDYGLTSQ